jgi:hypothetical protein
MRLPDDGERCDFADMCLPLSVRLVVVVRWFLAGFGKGEN